MYPNQRGTGANQLPDAQALASCGVSRRHGPYPGNANAGRDARAIRMCIGITWKHQAEGGDPIAAFQFDASAVQGHYRSHNGQSQAGRRRRICARPFGAIKTTEQARNTSRINRCLLIKRVHNRLVTYHCRLQSDCRTRGRMANRIGNEVVDRTVKQVGSALTVALPRTSSTTPESSAMPSK